VSASFLPADAKAAMLISFQSELAALQRELGLDVEKVR
jgi:hypothetical protein